MRKFVLYADDDADDKAWIAEACQSLASSIDVDFVENGKEVLNYLSPLSKSQFPSLILLDLNMPALDGKQTLQQLKNNPQYKGIPVAILSNACNPMDQQFCQRLGASGFFIKPASQKGWENIIRELTPLAP